MTQGKIIFICTQNSARSQMAAGFAKQIAEPSVEIFSAGTEPADRVHPMAIEVMKEFGVDISGEHPTHFIALENHRFDLGITLCRSAQTDCQGITGAPTLIHWDLPDPASGPEPHAEMKERFKTTATHIQQLVADLFQRGYFQAFSVLQNNLTHVLNCISEATIVHDMNRKIFFFSDGAAKLTGLSPSAVLGKDCHDVFSPHLCGLNCSFCEGEVTDFEDKHYTTVFRDKDSVRRECDVTVIPMRNADGKMHGVIASLRDDTEKNALERRLKKQKNFRGIIGCDHQMLQVFQQIRDVAVYDYPVHIHGETGVGKELVARAIHDESNRSDGPFVPINCGALPEGLVESELFGHVKGSFSGAIRDKKGRFELAKGGTIFLDEIADLPKPIQVKLLRFLQEGTFERVGDEKTIKVDTRIISATNKDLKEEVKKDTFREDLYYRLNVIPFSLPALRKRKNDIILLCEHFLHEIDVNYNNQPHTLSSDALSLLLEYDWPGNVRELENAIRFAVVKCKGEIITAQDLPIELQVNHAPPTQRGPSRKLDLESVKNALVKTGGNKAKAARQLGIGRATLYRFLTDHPNIID